MIELIQGLPDGVVGFEAVGTVTSNDYENTMVPAVDRALAAHEKIQVCARGRNRGSVSPARREVFG